MASNHSYVSLETLQRTGYAMLSLTTVFVAARVAIQIGRRKGLGPPDYLIYVSFLFYTEVCALYLFMAPRLFRFNDVMAGEAEAWPTMQRDVVVLYNNLFVNTLLFWTCLWCAKLSLLVLYRKLMVGLPYVHMRLWWDIVVFCVLSWAGCIVSGLMSCTNLHGFLANGECGTKDDIRAQVASLYYAFAVDIITDFMVMFLPMKLTWNLMMPRSQKFGVRVLFGTGFVCILFATIRVVQIGSKTDGGSTQPDPAWLMLWTMLESSVAVIIACCPAFAALGMYRTAKDVQLRRSHDPRGYLKQESNGLDELRSDVKLQMLVTAEHGSRHNVDWPEDRGSQDGLARRWRDIRVTTTFQRADSRVGTAY
ncbi:hypothetical protein EJ07DRAFT_139116 [Lizonia empirigonia]|nr:hypothetical protein EJ07DRAFT_139116 [Lizonia empirigonia]